MTFRRYTLGLLLLVLLVLAAVVVFNRVIDPFWYYRDFEITGVNAVKPRFARFERHVKPALLQREQPQAIILGSSFSGIGFDPLDAALTDGGKLKGYNFAFAGTNWDHEQCAFEYAVRNAPIKRVVLGISPGPHPTADCAKVWSGMTVTQAELLLSTNALDNAVRTVTEQRRARPSHTREGRYLYARGVPGVAARYKEYFARLDYTARCGRERFEAKVAAKPVEIAPMADWDVSGLRALLKLARERGVTVALVVYPRHALAQELELICGDSLTRWRGVETLSRVVTEEAPGGNAALWLFDDYNALSGERVSVNTGEPVFWQDPAHFNHEFGARMMAAMFGGDTRFGVKLPPGAATAAYAQWLQQRERYLAETPWFRSDLNALALHSIK